LDPRTVTRAANALAASGPPRGVDPAIAAIYDELRDMASLHLARSAGSTLQATDLVHEAFIKLFRPGQGAWENRRHFYGSAARAMQQILIDHWRSRSLPLASEEQLAGLEGAGRVHPRPLVEALDRLSELDAEIAEIVRLRIFAGLSVEQTADVLGVSDRTVKRHFAFARTWLYRQLCTDQEGDGMPGGGPSAGIS
jgi:RNA polymerase sigma factor (TIGR02999 family)